DPLSAPRAHRDVAVVGRAADSAEWAARGAGRRPRRRWRVAADPPSRTLRMSATEGPARRGRRRPRGLSARALKAWSAGAAAVIFLGSLNYASAHLYNASAPLQPTLAGAVAQATAAGTATATGTRTSSATSSFASVTTTTR